MSKLLMEERSKVLVHFVQDIAILNILIRKSGITLAHHVWCGTWRMAIFRTLVLKR